MKSGVLAILTCAVGLGVGSPAADPPQFTTMALPPPPSQVTPTSTPCPTVTSKGICPTCIMPACIQISTIYDIPGCPSPAPTMIQDYFCGYPCPPAACSTSYVYPGSTTVTPTVTASCCRSTATVSGLASRLYSLV